MSDIPARLYLTVLLAVCPLWPGWCDLETSLERQIGHVAAAAIEADVGVLQSTPLTKWVAQIGGDIARVSGRPDLRFRFKILASPEVNAIALPGGHVYIYQGLLSRLSSESELAGVIAHEIAHLHDKDFQRLLKRQLVFLGILSLARREDSRSLETGLGLVQLLNTLRHSRKHERQADAVGVQLAMRAGYDPRGLLGFLKYISAGEGQDDWASRAFATHPPPASRLKSGAAAVLRAERADYESLMRVAERLGQQGYSVRPLELYAAASEVRPEAPEPYVRRATILKRRARWAEAAAACEQAARVSGSADLSAEARALRQDAQGPEPSEVPADPDLVERLATLEEQLNERGKSHAATRRRLLANIQRAGRDRRVQQALTYGQLLDGEWHGERFVATLLAARELLKRCTRWPGEALEVCWRESETRRSLARLATAAQTLNPGSDREAASEITERLIESALSDADEASEAIKRLASVSDEVRDATIQCSVVLLALLGVGTDDPLGPMNWTTFAVTSSQLTGARSRIRRADRQLSAATATVTEGAIRANEAELDWEGAQAPRAADHPYAILIARRVGLSPAEFLERWQSCDALGLATRRACEKMAQEDAVHIARETCFVLVRLAGNDVRAEKLPPAWSAREPGN